MANNTDGTSVGNLNTVYQHYGLAIGISNDKMCVYASYKAEELIEEENPVDFLSGEYFDNLLKELGISYGIDKKTIEEFIKEPNDENPVLIAKGKPVVHGQDAVIEYIHQDKKEIAPKHLEGGKVDLKDLGIKINVTKSEPLAIKSPATLGVPGITVTGEEIPAKAGKDKKFLVGTHTVVSEDGLSLLAENEGTLSIVGGKISIVELYIVKGDVDYSTGNIDFVGSVEVKGNVLSGFSIKAKHDVTIDGLVEGAKIESGGNIVIKKGIQGAQKSIIRAHGNIEAKFINGAKLFAEGNIEISGPVTLSEIHAGMNIVLKGRNGSVSGGSMKASQGIEVENLGSEARVPTIVEVGRNPEHSTKLRSFITEEIKTAAVNLPKMIQMTKVLNKMKDTAGGKLSAEREKQLMDCIKTRYSLMALLKRLKEEEKELEDMISNSRLNGFVTVRGIVYQGVTIRIGKSFCKISDEMKHVTYRREEGEVKVFSI